MAQTGREALIEQITEIVRPRRRVRKGSKLSKSNSLAAANSGCCGSTSTSRRVSRTATARLSHSKSARILDAEDIIPGEHYTLEVSSPGSRAQADQARATSSVSRDRRQKLSRTSRSKSRSIGKAFFAVLRGEQILIEPSEGRIDPHPTVRRQTSKPEVRVVTPRHS